LGPASKRHERWPALQNVDEHPIKKGYHSDGGDITVINPWLNFYTIVTGRISPATDSRRSTLTRQEMIWLATAANKWFIWEDDIGSIEVGNTADLAVLDRDFFTFRKKISVACALHDRCRRQNRLQQRRGVVGSSVNRHAFSDQEFAKSRRLCVAIPFLLAPVPFRPFRVSV
jgi:hypothetical protein